MKKVLKIIGIILIIGFVLILITNNYVKSKYEYKIINIKEVNNIESIDAIIVLGAKANNNKVSLMLKDRLDKAIEVFNNSNIKNILNTGSINEVEAMSNYLKLNNIDIINIKEDNQGLSTYESIKNIKEIFEYKKILIVTQKYHLYRALYIANELDIDAYGISAEEKKYKGQIYRDIREVLARNKDFILSI